MVLSVYRVSAPAKDAGKSDGELTSSQTTDEASEQQSFTSLEGTTGNLFTGKAVRKYLGSRLKGGSIVGDSARKRFVILCDQNNGVGVMQPLL